MKRTKRLIAWLLTFAILLAGCGSAATAEATPEDIRAQLEETIAETFIAQDNPADWVIFDLAAYGSELSEEKKSAYLESAIAAVSSETAAPTDLAKAEIILSALGMDTTDLNGISIPDKIHSLASFPTYSDAIWVLISDTLDSVTLSDEQKTAAVAKISESISEKGLLFGTYGGYTYDDPDSTGAAIGALCPLTGDDDTYGANALYEKMLAALSGLQGENGSFGSACTDAFVVIGLCAAGIDADSDERFVKGENSLLDGLMSYAIEGGFAGYDGSLDLDWSTEQGFRALIAYRNFKASENAFNLYYTASSPNVDEDTGDNDNPDVNIPNHSGGQNAEITKPETPENTPEETPEEPEENLIRVTFEMKTHKKTWIAAHTVSVREKTSVKNLIMQVFDEYGVESSGLSTGYLRSVTYNGETWGEFDAGGGSGWQYYVNGDLPRVGIGSYKLQDGDFVSLRYTADYTDTENAEDEKTTEAEDTEEAPAPETEATQLPWQNPYSDVSESDWFFDSVKQANVLGLMQGVSESLFAPKKILSRAMFVTVLYRLDGSPECTGEDFDDVSSDAWYTSAVCWASKNGIVNGTSESTFSPDAAVTREQMATLAYRYAVYKKSASTPSSSLTFSDNGSISPFAEDAVRWTNENGIMSGSGSTFNPKNHSTRAEAAAVFCRLYDLINK